jgi:molybdopterin molybdotransferase
MISVAEAQARILAAFQPLPGEMIGLTEGLGRVLASDVIARVTQPPVAISAMDGYAVRAADVVRVPAILHQVGEAPAGGAYAGTVRPGEAVRIFTGAPVPDGADTIVIQENTDVDGARITVKEIAKPGSFIRPAGLDFTAGAVGLSAGRLLTARDIGLAASMNVPWLRVHRRPRVAILATGDEIVMPGDPIGPNQIVSSNSHALAAMIAAHGGVPINLGIALDTAESLVSLVAGADRADLLVTSGGASAGDHDLIRPVLGRQGMEVDFYKVAMRPGKPLIFGRFGSAPVLGLPGNPVSSLVCAILFLLPALRVLQGLPAHPDVPAGAQLGAPLPANDRRQDYLRASLSPGENGHRIATPFKLQDSSAMSLLSRADCLIVRPPFAPPADTGATVEILPLSGGLISL